METTQPAGVADRIVASVLRSRLHRLLSRWVCLIRYDGRRTGRSICTPTQYAAGPLGFVIYVGRPDTKTWWRNFIGGADLDVLVAGTWRRSHAEAVVGAEDAERIEPLLAAFVDRYPRAAKTIEGSRDPDGTSRAVVVHIVERLTEPTSAGDAIDDAPVEEAT